MPGILGIIGCAPASERNSQVELMRKSMLHEPFYSSGKLANDRLEFAVGWVCHQGSYSDCLPVWNETRDVCLIFAGENFADPADVEVLRARGHQFEAGNGSYLVHLYEEQGPEFVQKLNGWFCGVVLDLRLESVILFNDRYGFSRLYIHEQPDGLLFASEAKALLKVRPVLRELDPQSLAERFACGCVLQNRTIFSKILLLPGASRWTFSRSQSPRKEVYFKPETWESQSQLNAAEYYEKFRETFSRILPRYFRHEHPLALSLTGGLDSRMILAWSGCAPDTLPCYTFGGSYRDCKDVTVARMLAEECQQPHQVIPVNGDFIDNFPALAERAVYLSDGAMDVAGSVELYVNQIARQIAPIRLTGNYGSEILRAGVAFKPELRQNVFYEPEFALRLNGASETYASELRGKRISFIAFKQVPWFHYSRLSLEQSQLTVRAPYLDNELVQLVYQAAPESLQSKEQCLRLIADANPALARMPTDRGVSYPPTPFVAASRRLLQEFTVKAEHAYDTGMPQWLARADRVLSPLHLEKIFLGHHKFYHFRVWYRDQLGAYLKEVLLDPLTRQRSHLRGNCLEKLVLDHVNGRRNYTAELHQVLTLELIHRRLLGYK